jgi:hypothetical protein
MLTRDAPLFFLSDSCNFCASAAVIMVGSTPTALPPSACSAVLRSAQSLWWISKQSIAYHSCQVGTSSIPCFRSVQLLSSCFEAWLKYLPSVAREAFSGVTTAVPAEPEKPQIYSIPCEYQHRKMGASKPHLFEHRRVQCIRIDGCLQMGRQMACHVR